MNKLTNIREYSEGNSVFITNQTKIEGKDDDRCVIESNVLGDWYTTYVDLGDVIDWVKENMPELLE